MREELNPPGSQGAWSETPTAIPVARPIPIAAGGVSGQTNDELLLPGSTRSAAWKDIGSLVVILLSFEVCASLAVARIAGIGALPVTTPQTTIDRLMLVPMLLVRAAGVVATIAVILRHRNQSFRSIGLARKGVWINLLLGLATLAVAYALIFAWQLSMLELWPQFGNRMAQNAERILEYVPRLQPRGFACFSLLVGSYEEMLFRGFLLVRFRRATNSWVVAVGLSTLLFAGPHMPFQEWVALAPITILSLVFSVVTIWRRSIVPAIVGHWLFDLSQFLGLYYWLGDSWK